MAPLFSLNEPLVQFLTRALYRTFLWKCFEFRPVRFRRCCHHQEKLLVWVCHIVVNHMSQLIYILKRKSFATLTKCYFLLFEPKILLHDIMINKSNDLPSKQHENQTSETYDCRSSTRNVRQPKFEKSQSYNTLHFIESQCYTTLHFIRKRCLTIICFQNQKGRQIQAGYFMHLVTFITST